MSVPRKNPASHESDLPGTDWTREKSTQLAGPRRGGELGARSTARLAKFHVPEIVFGPGALAELGHCAARLGARRPFLVTDPGLIEAGWVDEAIGYLRQSELHPALWHNVTPNPKDHEIEAAFQMYAAGGIRTEGVPAGEVALLLAERVRELADEVGVPKGLAALGVTEAELPQMAQTTLRDACMTTNPREAGAMDIEALFRAAL